MGSPPALKGFVLDCALTVRAGATRCCPGPPVLDAVVLLTGSPGVSFLHVPRKEWPWYVAAAVALAIGSTGPVAWLCAGLFLGFCMWPGVVPVGRRRGRRQVAPVFCKTPLAVAGWRGLRHFVARPTDASDPTGVSRGRWSKSQRRGRPREPD